MDKALSGNHNYGSLLIYVLETIVNLSLDIVYLKFLVMLDRLN